MMSAKICFALLVLLSTGGTSAFDRAAQVEKSLLPANVVRGESIPHMSLADRMQHHSIPGVSIAVIHQGKLDWARAYGVLEAGGRDSVTTETLFQAGSISKVVAAILALRLVEAHKISLDEDLNRKLRTWKIPSNEWAAQRPATLRQALSHTAGITVHGFPGYGVEDSLPTLVQVLDGVRPANTAAIQVDALPGSAFRYSGGGFTVFQQLAIDVTGKTFPALMQKEVIDIIGMPRSTFLEPIPKSLEANAARGHDAKGEMIPGGWHIYPEMAAAGMWSTPSDLAELGIEMRRAAEGKSELLSREMAKDMLSPQAPSTGGLGWELSGGDTATTFLHGGDTAGYKCFMMIYRKSGNGAVIMTNGDRGESLIGEILRGLAQAYQWPSLHPRERTVVQVPTSVLTDYVGEYALDIAPNILVEITRDDAKLMLRVIQPGGRESSEILPESETVFFVRDSDFQVTFPRDEDGQVRRLVIDQRGETYRARKK